MYQYNVVDPIEAKLQVVQQLNQSLGYCTCINIPFDTRQLYGSWL